MKNQIALPVHQAKESRISLWLKKEWRKRSIPTHLERHNPPTIIAKMGLKRA